MLKIEKIWIKIFADEISDMSDYLGKYNENPEGEGVIDRKENNDQGRNEFRYFHPAIPEHGDEDYARMEMYNRGEICLLGVEAKAEVSYPIGTIGQRRLEVLSSGGLYGVESDCSEYLEEVKSEQLNDLKEHLKQFNVDLSNFDKLAKLGETQSAGFVEYV